MAGGCAALLVLGTNTVMAQERGGPPDPAQMKQRILDDMRDQMELKDDAEWSAIKPKLTKVIDVREEVMAGARHGHFGRGPRHNGGGGGEGEDNGGRRHQHEWGGGEPSAAVQALQKAVDGKAPTAEIKAKLKVVQDEAKARQAKLAAAQEDLRAVLTPRQEAVATLHGLLQ